MTEEQKKYYNAMKKLGSKKPQKPIPRPQVPPLWAPCPVCGARLLPRGLMGIKDFLPSTHQAVSLGEVRPTPGAGHVVSLQGEMPLCSATDTAFAQRLSMELQWLLYPHLTL